MEKFSIEQKKVPQTSRLCRLDDFFENREKGIIRKFKICIVKQLNVVCTNLASALQTTKLVSPLARRVRFHSTPASHSAIDSSNKLIVICMFLEQRESSKSLHIPCQRKCYATNVWSIKYIRFLWVWHGLCSQCFGFSISICQRIDFIQHFAHDKKFKSRKAHLSTRYLTQFVRDVLAAAAKAKENGPISETMQPQSPIKHIKLFAWHKLLS